MKPCCDELARATGIYKGYAHLNPPSMRPDGQIEQDEDKRWHVNGCCGGGCYVLRDIKFCPFCGTKLP